MKNKHKFAVFHICGNRDKIYHSMTKYCIRLCYLLREAGVKCYFISNLKTLDIDPRFSDILCRIFDWLNVTENDIEKIISNNISSEIIPIIHLHLSYPRHGTWLKPSFFSKFLTVITVHEHSNKKQNEKNSQINYLQHAKKIFYPSYKELNYISKRLTNIKDKAQLCSDCYISVKSSRSYLVYPVPPTSIPPTNILRNQQAKDIAWLGMLRNGHDWNLLLNIASLLSNNCPEINFHIIGASVNPVKLIELLERLFRVNLSTFRQKIMYDGVNYNEFIFEKLIDEANYLINNHSRLLNNIIVHLDISDLDLSLLLLDKCMIGLQTDVNIHIDHSSSVISLMAHGLPVIVCDNINHIQCEESKKLMEALFVIPYETEKQFVNDTVDLINNLYLHKELLTEKRKKVYDYLITRDGKNLVLACEAVYNEILNDSF